MVKYLKVGFYGFVISFLGTLPLGTINITAFNIAASTSINDAVWFIVAVVFVELLVVLLTLMGNEKINFEGKLSFYLIPIGAAVLLYMAAHSFITASSVEELNSTTPIFPGIQSSFILGILLSTLNPMHIPFWMTWNRILMAKRTLHKTKRSYTTYISGIGIGSLVGLLLFIFAGSHIFQNYDQYSMIINLSLGILYLGFSIYLIFLLYEKHLKLKIQ